MKLRRYLSARRFKVKDFAISIGITVRHLYLIMGGKKNTSQRTLLRINHITGDEVKTMEDLIDDGKEHKIET